MASRGLVVEPGDAGCAVWLALEGVRGGVTAGRRVVDRVGEAPVVVGVRVAELVRCRW